MKKRTFIFLILPYERMGASTPMLRMYKAESVSDAFILSQNPHDDDTEYTKKEYCEDYWGEDNEEDYPTTEKQWEDHIYELGDGGDAIAISELVDDELVQLVSIDI